MKISVSASGAFVVMGLINATSRSASTLTVSLALVPLPAKLSASAPGGVLTVIFALGEEEEMSTLGERGKPNKFLSVSSPCSLEALLSVRFPSGLVGVLVSVMRWESVEWIISCVVDIEEEEVGKRLGTLLETEEEVV